MFFIASSKDGTILSLSATRCHIIAFIASLTMVEWVCSSVMRTFQHKLVQGLTLDHLETIDLVVQLSLVIILCFHKEQTGAAFVWDSADRISISFICNKIVFSHTENDRIFTIWSLLNAG